MYTAQQFVFIEFAKTGASHVGSLLKKIAEGKNDPKTEPNADELIASGKYVIGSICDPWSWYLALWWDGCLQKGAVYERLTTPSYWANLLIKNAQIDDPVAAFEPTDKLPPGISPALARDAWYLNPDDAQAFRRWLQAVVAVPALRPVLDPAWVRSRIARMGGLMTYRYFTQYVRGAGSAGETLASLQGLRSYDDLHGIAHAFIRRESQADDLLRALGAAGVRLDAGHEKRIREARPATVADRPHGLSHYYDAESADLVWRRERFIIDKFGYASAKP